MDGIHTIGIILTRDTDGIILTRDTDGIILIGDMDGTTPHIIIIILDLHTLLVIATIIFLMVTEIQTIQILATETSLTHHI